MARTYDNYADLITFTRASSGTALRPISYGDELVVNGDFSTDSDWTDASTGDGSSSISGGTMTITDANGGVGRAYQNITIKTGALYEISFDTSGSNDLYIVATALGINQAFSKNETHNLKIVASSSALQINLYCSGASGSAIVDNISVREVLFDQPNGTLTLFNHPTNIPRIEYDADGNRLGLLVEESRSNLLTYSEDFSNAAWSKYYSIAVTPSNETSPDGQTNAYELSNINSTDADIGLTDNLSASPSTTYTGSIWVKAKTTSDVGKYIKIRLKRAGGTFVASDTIVQLSDSWVRHSVTVTLLADNTGIGFTVTRDNGTPEADRADECLIYGAQVETGSFPTSYIPTSGSTATRSADVASIGVSEFGYNQSEGSFFVEFSPFINTTQSAVMSVGSSSTNAIGVYSYNTYQLRNVVGGSSNVLLDNGAVSDENKVAATYKVNDFTLSLNGNSVSTDTSGDLQAIVNTTMYIGSFATINQYSGHIKSIKYYPRALTATQIQELTS